jgi:hypothetical protein
MKNDRDNYLLPRWCQDTKKGKDSKKWKVLCQLLVVLRLLIDVGCHFTIAVVIIAAGSCTRGAMPKAANSVGVSEA